GNVHSKYVQNFSPWGLDDIRPLGSSLPGTISVGGPQNTVDAWSANQGTHCTNCFAIPHGTGTNFSGGASAVGPTAPCSPSTLNWSSFGIGGSGGTNGTRNVFDPNSIAFEDSAQQRNAATITLDQRLTKDISFYGEAFYSNRRVEQYSPGNL